MRASVLADPDVHWISSCGGRFVVLPDSSLADWRGYPDDGRDPLDASHDYGRACAATGYASMLPVGKIHALVFGENESGGVYLGRKHPILFEWIYADSTDAVIGALQRLPDGFDSDAELQFDVTSNHLNVFDSAFSGLDFEPQHSCRFPIQPGRFTIASTLYEPYEDTGLIIHRFIRA